MWKVSLIISDNLVICVIGVLDIYVKLAIRSQVLLIILPVLITISE